MKRHVTQNTNIRRGLVRVPATDLLLRRLAPTLAAAFRRGLEPPTSATLSIGLTTQPHWPNGGFVSWRVQEQEPYGSSTGSVKVS